jgi:hypothetical protein
MFTRWELPLGQFWLGGDLLPGLDFPEIVRLD